MRILHLLNHTRHLNGHVHAAVDLACAQAQAGFQVAVASEGGDFDALFAANGVEIIRIDLRRKPLVAAKAIASLIRLVRRFDIVHAHMMASALLAWPACRLTRTPLVTTVHNEFERGAIAMRVGNRVIGVSEAVTQSMHRRGIPASRLRTVLNGTIGSPRHSGAPVVRAKQGSPSILFVAGLHPRKGLPDLLAAFDIVAASLPDAMLHIVGTGPFEEAYRAEAAALPSGSRIHFHGGQNDPRPWFFSSDIFVLPSHAEPAGLVLSEASEAGLALVGTRVGGIPEMLDHGQAGILVPPKDPAALADALLRLITTPGALDDAKERSLHNATRMSLARVMKETVDIYWECLPKPLSQDKRPSSRQAMQGS